MDEKVAQQLLMYFLNVKFFAMKKPNSNSNSKDTRLDLEANIYHPFDMGSYTNYFRVGEFLMNSDRRSSYWPRFAEKHLFL